MTPHVLGTYSVRVISLMGKSSIYSIIVGRHLHLYYIQIINHTQSPERAVVVVDM